jgi:hypothetical protein
LTRHKDGKLPYDGSIDWSALVSTYRKEPVDHLKWLAAYFGYANVDSFQRAMRKRGIKRVMDVHVCQPDESCGQAEIESNDVNIPLKLATDKSPKTVAFICDTHNPYQDRKIVRLTREFLKERQPDYLIFGGDMCDFYQISTFDKNPERKDKLQADLDSTHDMLGEFCQDLPNTIFYYLEGNHEDRLRKTLWSNADAFSSLRVMKLESLLGLSDYHITLIPYEKGLMINDSFLALHGDISSINSGWTAKRLYEKHGGCGIAGHCHRQGSYLKRNRFGVYGWWEGGCLCTLEPDYISHPNWTQGFSLVTFIGKRFFVESIPIVDGKFIFGSRLYE